MLRTFAHSFDPPSANPVKGPNAELTINEIEDAGIREVLQTPGATLGSWAILDALLAPTGAGTPFIFREPLGQAREVKVALSGLFGRFVARAYLERYFALSIFTHLGQRTILLDGKRRIEIRRKPGQRGDLPDWVACDSTLGKLTVAEAKGCHDKPGPNKALARAWSQADRIDVVSGGKTATIKRIAIATRWGASTGGAGTPLLAVRDPDDAGEMSVEDLGAASVGLVRFHVANLLKALGYGEAATSLLLLASARNDRVEGQASQAAIAAVNAAPLHDVTEPMADIGPSDGLLGAWVTRAGPLPESSLSRADQEILRRLDFRPVFVGVERRVVKAAIDGDAQHLRALMTSTRQTTGGVRTDGGACWMIRPAEGTAIS
jgi:hypothetical protein